MYFIYLFGMWTPTFILTLASPLILLFEAISTTNAILFLHAPVSCPLCTLYFHFFTIPLISSCTLSYSYRTSQQIIKAINRTNGRARMQRVFHALFSSRILLNLRKYGRTTITYETSEVSSRDLSGLSALRFADVTSLGSTQWTTA